jgi:hypothetical protein
MRRDTRNRISRIAAKLRQDVQDIFFGVGGDFPLHLAYLAAA